MNNPTPNQNGKTRKVVFRKKRKKRQKDSSRNIIQKKAVYSRNRITILRDVILNLTVKTRWFSSAILFIYILINSVDFSILLNLSTSGDQLQFTPGGSRFDKILEVEEGIDYRAELNKVIYAATAMMLIFQFKSIVAFVRKNLHLILIIITIAFGVSQSIDSERVIINTIQLLSGLILAIVYALANKNEPYRYINFCSLCMFPLFIIHLFSFIIFVANGFDFTTFLTGERRYGGLSGNPNTSGGQTVLGLWFSMSLIFRAKTRLLKYWGAFSFFIFSFSLATSGSGTSTIAAACIIFTMIFTTAFIYFRLGGRIIYSLSATLAAIVVSYFVFDTGLDAVSSSVFDNLGKDETLTGRTEIWDVGIAAFLERPIFGWSLDFNASVFDNRRFELPSFVEHFHNGYIETLVSGGLVLGILVLYNFWRYIINYWKSTRVSNNAYGMIVGLIILLVLNFSEYSILRPRSVIYQVYITAFCMITVAAYANTEKSLNLVLLIKKLNRKTSRRKRSRRRAS